MKEGMVLGTNDHTFLHCPPAPTPDTITHESTRYPP